MEISAAGLALIKKSEGFRGHVYKDVHGYPTIGYGHKLAQPDAFPGGIDKAFAEHILACDCDDVEEAIAHLVKVPLTQGQFDALADFVFNLGAGRLAESTLLHDLNAHRYDDAAEQLLRWDHAEVNGHPLELDSLKARREAEFALWHGRDPHDPAKAADVHPTNMDPSAGTPEVAA